MTLSILSLIVFIAISTVECSKSIKKIEVCPCVPNNICPEVNRFSREDAKYFQTVLKCSEEDFVRCCPPSKLPKKAMQRNDDVENIILVDEVPGKSADHQVDVKPSEEIPEAVTEVDEVTTLEPESMNIENDISTLISVEELTTTEIPSLKQEEPSEISDKKREGKIEDSDVFMIFPKKENSEGNSIEKDLHIIFPNGEIEAALATSTSNAENIEISDTSTETPKRVVIHKKLLNKTSETLEASESEISEVVHERVDIDEVKRRLTVMMRNNKRRKNSISSIATTPMTSTNTPTTTTTERSVEETTHKTPRRKIKIRKHKQVTTESPITATTLTATQSSETSTSQSRRKIIYDTSSRTNFLRRPSASQSSDDEEETEITETSSLSPEITSASFLIHETFKPFDSPEHSKPAENEHHDMIEAIHKALHSGVDIQLIENMLRKHKNKLKGNRFDDSSDQPTKPNRGSIKFQPHQTRSQTTESDNYPTRFRTTETENYPTRPQTTRFVTRPTTTEFENYPTRPQTRPATRQQTAVTENYRTRRPTAPGDYSFTQIIGLGSKDSPNIRTTTVATPHTTQKLPPRIIVTQPSSNSQRINDDITIDGKISSSQNKKPSNEFRSSPLFGITMDRFNDYDSDTIEKIHETLRSPPSSQAGFFPVIQSGTPASPLYTLNQVF
ncbi:CLUMA_CG010789, isoform A [Clunio marinus]|uniref:CLUMA_CG010789, isoform A n=1 Tax=Clunio marinus TaxID=568069 RepID=A0A1J1IAT6_9DIPT|nr:CLUMA_CG010789, isoform A [Clunio marinus]